MRRPLFPDSAGIVSGPKLAAACSATGASTTVSFVACYYNISWNAEFIRLSAAVRRDATSIYAGSDTVDRDRVRIVLHVGHDLIVWFSVLPR